MKRLLFKRKKAYSLVEIIISMAVIAVVLTILFNTILITLRISYRNFSRSLIREEISEIASSINRDVRNADELLFCGGNQCQLLIDGTIIDWNLCSQDTSKICREESADGTSFTNTYESPSFVLVSQFEFASGFVGSSNEAQNNILFTIVAAHENESLNISNVVRQQSVSTRNYVR